MQNYDRDRHNSTVHALEIRPQAAGRRRASLAVHHRVNTNVLHVKYCHLHEETNAGRDFFAWLNTSKKNKVHSFQF